MRYRALAGRRSGWIEEQVHGRVDNHVSAPILEKVPLDVQPGATAAPRTV